MPIFDMGRAARLAFALGLTVASLLVLIIMAAPLTCGFPDPDWVFFSFLLFFIVGFIWTAAELVRPQALALPVALGLYFAVGPIGMAIARGASDDWDLHQESTWMPFWLIGVFLATEVLPGSC